jgi:hypothetical protein
MSSIQEMIMQRLTPDTISQISQSIGADPATTRQAVDAAVPMMIGGMAAHANTPQGASTIETAASEHGGILDSIGDMMGGSGSSGGLGGVLGGLGGMLGGAGGGGILASILGSSHNDVADGVAQSSGLDRDKAMRLMTILAPIVLGVLSRRRNQSDTAATIPVSNELQREAETHSANPQFGGIIGGILNKATGRS